MISRDRDRDDKDTLLVQFLWRTLVNILHKKCCHISYPVGGLWKLFVQINVCSFFRLVPLGKECKLV